MAKARSRAAARKVKDRWKAKNWYNVLAPASFDNAAIAETLADEPSKLTDRVTEITLQDLTNDFRKSHIKLFFKVDQIEDNNAKTVYIGHTLTSDYLRRMVRRRRSKIDAVYEAKTRDGARIRIKPFATTDRRIQNSQKKIIRLTMRKTILTNARAMTLSEFIKYIIEGKLGSDIYKSCKKFYPVRRIEIYKTEVLQQPTIEIEDAKPSESNEKAEPRDDVESEEESKEVSTKEESEEEIEEEKIKENGEESTDESEELTETPSEEKEPEATDEEIVESEEEVEKQEEEDSEELTETASEEEEPETSDEEIVESEEEVEKQEEEESEEKKK